MQNGKQHSIVFNYPEDLLFSLKLSEKEFEKEFKTAAVVKLYERGIISTVKPLIEKMLANRRYLSEKIILDLLKSADE